MPKLARKTSLANDNFSYSLQEPESPREYYKIYVQKGSFGDNHFTIQYRGSYLPLENLKYFNVQEILSLSLQDERGEQYGLVCVYAVKQIPPETPL